MKSLLAIALCACAVSTAAHAGRPDIEAAMLLTGKITVSPQGAVGAYAIDKAGKVPAAVTSLLARTLPHWHFRPAVRDGRPVAIHASMALRVVVRRSHDTYLLHVANATFRDLRQKPTDRVRVVHPGAIFYPGLPLREGIAGDVFVVVRIDRQGHATDAAAAQVNLRVSGRARRMQHWRALFAKSAVAFALGTAYAIPTTGPLAHHDHWDFCIPVHYAITDRPGEQEPAYGEWVDYVPGPRARIPWLDADERAAAASDAVPAGSVNMFGSGLKRMKAAAPDQKATPGNT